MNIYCERQVGDLCRLHSLNNYFGYKRFTQEDFYNYCDEYDSIITGLNSRKMDGFAEGRSIISYLIDKIDYKCLLLIPFNSYNDSRRHLDITFYNSLKKNVEIFFEFNKNHVWVNKKINNKYYKIDSISGIHETDNTKINKNGYLVVIEGDNIKKQTDHLITKIKESIIKGDIEDYFEVLFYNLFYCIKHIDTNIKNKLNDTHFMQNSVLIENLIALDNIKVKLHTFIKCLRDNKCYKKHKQILLNLIKYNFI